MAFVVNDHLPNHMLVSTEKLLHMGMVICISFSSIVCRANNIANSSVVYTDKWSDTLFLIYDSFCEIYTAAPANHISGSLLACVNINT